MSIKTAREINMDIVELNSDDRKYLARSDGEGFRRVVGKVLDVEWQFERWTRSVRLNFWVEDSYQSQGYDLVLGNDYIDVKYEQDR